jgi:hypothetical protein
MTDVFEHIADPRTLLREIRRVLKPDGILFIKVPNGRFNLFKLRVLGALGRLGDFDVFDSYEHVVHYTSPTLAHMLREEGFAVKHQSIARPIQLPVWHNLVGQYYQYPSPWILDWRRHIGRMLLYQASRVESLALGGQAGWLAPNIVVVAGKAQAGPFVPTTFSPGLGKRLTCVTPPSCSTLTTSRSRCGRS